MHHDQANVLIRRATIRLLDVGTREPDPRDPVAVADHHTSMCDLRAALSLAPGLAPDELDPARGTQTLASLYRRKLGPDARPFTRDATKNAHQED